MSGKNTRPLATKAVPTHCTRGRRVLKEKQGMRSSEMLHAYALSCRQLFADGLQFPPPFRGGIGIDHPEVFERIEDYL